MTVQLCKHFLQHVSFFSLIRFINFWGWNLPEKMDNLSEEFVEFQLLNDDDIPKAIWDKATVSVHEDEKSYHRMDILWQYVSTMKTPDHMPRFLMLAKVAMLVLIIPHSNAEEERVFSMVRTKQDLLPTKSRPKKAKSATWNYNWGHTSQ